MESTTVRIPVCKKGGVVIGYMLVDECDAQIVSQRTWSLDSHGYPQGAMQGDTILIHRLVMSPQPYQIVDHINGDLLDNRRCNLRFATKAQNNMNRRKTGNCSSRYKGVCWNKKNRNWLAGIKVNGKRKNIGSFKDEEAAARAYDAAAVEYFGEFAWLNFP